MKKIKLAKSQTNGRVGVYISNDAKSGALVELLCQTDFASRTAEFKEAANFCAKLLLEKEDVSALDLVIGELKTQIKEEVTLGRYEVFYM